MAPRDTFPNDPTGERLRLAHRRGDDLTLVREVTFTIDFPTITSVAVFIAELDEEVPDRCPDRVVEQTLDVTVRCVPEYDVLSELEALIEGLAENAGANFMGWDF